MKIPATCLLLSLLAPVGNAATIWLNEFHYEDIGLDTNEFIEIIVDTDVIAIADVSVSLYNGNNNGVYATVNSFVAGDLLSGGYQVFSVLRTGIQNGPSDGFSVNVSGVSQAFLSYEGTLTASGGPADGLMSFDIGLSESNTSTSETSSLGLTGSGMMGAADGGDFTWAVAVDTASRGSLNAGQILVVPEPGTPVLITLAAFGLIARRRRSW